MSKKANFTPEEERILLVALREHYGKDVITTPELNSFVKSEKIPYPYFIINDSNRRVGWGKYNIQPVDMQGAVVIPMRKPVP